MKTASSEREIPDISVRGLAARMAGLGALFFSEKLFLDGFVNSQRAQAAAGVGGFVRVAQHWGFRFLVTFIATVIVFAYVRDLWNAVLVRSLDRIGPLHVRWAITHLVGIILLVFASINLYPPGGTQVRFAIVFCAWVVLAGASIYAALMTIAPKAVWVDVARSVGAIWIYAFLAALLTMCAWSLSERFWTPTANVTFQVVRLMLLPILPNLQANAESRILGTDRFAVEITEVCSGLEGMGMMLAFVTAWLLFFRREYIFPRALILVPAGLLAMFMLNAVRIAILMLIGYAGYPEVAAYGFHSQAGWIAFNTAACGLVLLSRRIRWINRAPIQRVDPSATGNPTAIYLMPLLVLLASGVLSHSMSARFENFYPIRLAGGILVLVLYRRELLSLPWKGSWRGPAVGAAIFLVWMIAAHFVLPTSPPPSELSSLPSGIRILWVISRIGVSVLIVPIAEELAYRGFLMRRFCAIEFESFPYEKVGMLGLFISAVAFGLMHGAMWLPGIIAGLSYGLIAMRRANLGEAVLAHATTNALVAVAVLTLDQWQLW